MPSLYDRAAIIPGRSMTRSKAPDRLRKAWAVDGLGAEILDSEGRRYLDMVCGLGAISLGYGYHTPKAMGGVYSLPHVLEAEAAEAILKHVAPWATSVRTVKTGSEATHAAYRVAKAATRRSLVAVAQDAYHGWHEWSSETASLLIRYTHGDAKWFYGPWLSRESLAAVFYEPPRFGPVDVEWVRWLRNYCDNEGALLVFDSMIYGGRFALGGLSEYSGVIPDAECFGKAFGNGEAIAFIVGREALADHGEIVSGTYSGDTTGLQAVLDTLQRYTSDSVIDTLWDRARCLYDHWQAHVPASFCTLSQAAPLMGLNFANPAHRVPFKDAMAERGILVWQDWLMVMYAHTPEHMEHVARTAEEVCRQLA